MKLSRLCRCGCHRPVKKPRGQFATVGCNLRMRSPEQRRQWSRECGLARQRNWEGRLVDACAKLPTLREAILRAFWLGKRHAYRVRGANHGKPVTKDRAAA